MPHHLEGTMKVLKHILIFFLCLLVGTVIGQGSVMVGLGFLPSLILAGLAGVALGIAIDKLLWEKED